ncbi:MAG: hypothetical protein LV481_08995 [Methylacidiphilales bacterium]|nr:hypothetical protein [Candidatus Methylacidiphilales bacterium]
MALIPKPVSSALTALALLLLAGMAASFPLVAADNAPVKYRSVDRIKGIGKFVFGAALKDFPPGLLQPVDPRAHGVLLRVSPYGNNYLVKDLSGLTWGAIPVAGMVVTFHDNVLIDLQVVLKAKKGDFYVADRAFKEKYGPSNPKTFPVETWAGDVVEVTLIIANCTIKDEKSLEERTQAKLELFDTGAWNNYLSDQKAKLQSVLDQRYKASGSKAKTDL